MSPSDSDFVARFLLEELDIRGAFVRLGESWRSMLARRDYAATVRELLGEMTATAVLIGSNLKQPGRLSFQLKGHGPIGFLFIDCTEQLHLRGMAQAAADVAPAPVSQLFGDGHLSLILQNASAREPYQSLVPAAGESIAAIFEHYLLQSEQQPARLLLSAGVLFGFVLTYYRVPQQFTELFLTWELGPYMVLAIVIAFYIVLGMFLEPVSMTFITLPTIFPLMQAAGFDMIWFGIVYTITMEIAVLTPPVGLNLYVIQGISRGTIAIGEVIHGCLPFFASMVVQIALLIALPETASWLPASGSPGNGIAVSSASSSALAAKCSRVAWL